MLVLGALVLACAHVFFLPLAAESMANAYPEVDYLRLPLTWVFGAALVAGEVVLLALWWLAPTLESGNRLTPTQRVQLGIVIGLLVLIGVMLAAVNNYLNSSLNANPPLIALGLFAVPLLCWAVAAVLLYSRRPGHHRSRSQIRQRPFWD